MQLNELFYQVKTRATYLQLVVILVESNEIKIKK